MILRLYILILEGKIVVLALYEVFLMGKDIRILRERHFLVMTSFENFVETTLERRRHFLKRGVCNISHFQLVSSL